MGLAGSQGMFRSCDLGMKPSPGEAPSALYIRRLPPDTWLWLWPWSSEDDDTFWTVGVVCKPGVRVEVSAFPLFLKLPSCYMETGSPVPWAGLDAGLGIEWRLPEGLRDLLVLPLTPQPPDSGLGLAVVLSLRNAGESSQSLLFLESLLP